MTKTLSYEVLDSGFFQKLEQVGPFRIVRPSPQSVWRPKLGEREWQDWSARFIRDSTGGGQWTIRDPKIKNPWQVEVSGLTFELTLTDFGHLGLFPEHIVKCTELQGWLREFADIKPKVLNLFAYTGAATMACAKAGAHVVHVDSSKTSVSWARRNAALSQIEDLPIRWVVDDARKFVKREITRGNKYHGIIVDPPSFGRGTKGEVWKIEKDLCELLDLLVQVLVDKPLFVLMSSHTSCYTPKALENLLAGFPKGMALTSGEMLIPEGKDRVLPCGGFAMLSSQDAHH